MLGLPAQSSPFLCSSALDLVATEDFCVKSSVSMRLKRNAPQLHTLVRLRTTQISEIGDDLHNWQFDATLVHRNLEFYLSCILASLLAINQFDWHFLSQPLLVLRHAMLLDWSKVSLGGSFQEATTFASFCTLDFEFDSACFSSDAYYERFISQMLFAQSALQCHGTNLIPNSLNLFHDVVLWCSLRGRFLFVMTQLLTRAIRNQLIRFFAYFSN